ncbi:protein S40-1-like [Typha latifolia]|uniref:protein S40-1-like n=1 Tax=Typha latifolia TaxID=4733 RepID=UPI003C2DF34A
MQEELYESDVIWADDQGRPMGAFVSSRSTKDKASYPATMPLAIQNSARITRGRIGERDEEEEVVELVPPHVLVSRRRGIGEEVAFSLCSGHGRTLKGRDLRHVRDSVLRMTGFFEG